MDLPEEYFEPILDVIMPKRTVKWIHKCSLEERKEHLELWPPGATSFNMLYSGSSEEGLFLPDLSRIRKPLSSSEALMINADRDIMIVWGDLPVHQEIRRRSFASVEVDEISPGYCRLRCNPGFLKSSITTNCLPELKLLESCFDKKAYLYNSKFVAAMTQILNLQKHGESMFKIPVSEQRYNVQTSHSKHGPAFTSRVVCHGGSDHSVDHVHSLHCPDWPKVASEWILRQRPSGWPSQQQVRDIARQGCHVVPVPHRRSRRPSVGWRLSFSAAEVKLALSISSIPRRCYIFVKLLHIYKFKACGAALPTYFLKTALFWLCERISLSQWRSMKTVEGIQHILQFLLISCEEQTLPNYFVPQNNMFNGLGVVQISKTREAIRQVLAHPVSHLIEFTKFYKASHMPFVSPIFEIVDCCLARFPRPIEDDEVRRFESCLRGHVINGLLTQGDSTYEAIEEISSCADIENLPSCKDCLLALEKLVQIESDLGGIDLQLQLATMASMYHNLGCLALLANDKEGHESFCQRAKTLFEKILPPSDSIDNRQIWMFVDYCNLLRSLGDYNKALGVVSAVFHTQTDNQFQNVYNTYASHNSHTADEYFSMGVEERGSLSVLSFGNLMYIAALCHLDRGRELRRNRHTGRKGAHVFADSLEEFVRMKCEKFPAMEDEDSIAMLGYLMLEMEEYHKAIEVFNLVLKLNPTFIHAEMYRDFAVKKISMNASSYAQ